MKCLVTGGAGFIGSNLVDRLIDDGHEVTIIDDLSTGKKENINEKALWSQLDIGIETSVPYMTMLMKGVDVVFHMACLARVQPSIDNPLLYHNKNVNGVVNVLEACREAGVKKLVFSSSSSVYGESETPTNEFMETNPMSPYALHKLIGEQYCKLFSELYDVETVCLRYSNAYGEGQPTSGAYCNVMGVFEQQKQMGKPMTIVGDGEQRRDFIYVGDIVEANIQVGFDKHPLKGAVLNIGSGKNYSVNQIAEWMGGETIHIEPRIEPRETLLDSNQMMECFDWKPTMELEKWVKNRQKKKE